MVKKTNTDTEFYNKIIGSTIKIMEKIVEIFKLYPIGPLEETAFKETDKKTLVEAFFKFWPILHSDLIYDIIKLINDNDFQDMLNKYPANMKLRFTRLLERFFMLAIYFYDNEEQSYLNFSDIYTSFSSYIDRSKLNELTKESLNKMILHMNNSSKLVEVAEFFADPEYFSPKHGKYKGILDNSTYSKLCKELFSLTGNELYLAPNICELGDDLKEIKRILKKFMDSNSSLDFLKEALMTLKGCMDKESYNELLRWTISEIDNLDVEKNNKTLKNMTEGIEYSNWIKKSDYKKELIQLVCELADIEQVLAYIEDNINKKTKKDIISACASIIDDNLAEEKMSIENRMLLWIEKKDYERIIKSQVGLLEYAETFVEDIFTANQFEEILWDIEEYAEEQIEKLLKEIEFDKEKEQKVNEMLVSLANLFKYEIRIPEMVNFLWELLEKVNRRRISRKVFKNLKKVLDTAETTCWTVIVLNQTTNISTFDDITYMPFLRIYCEISDIEDSSTPLEVSITVIYGNEIERDPLSESESFYRIEVE